MAQGNLPAELMQHISDTLAADVREDWILSTGGPYLRDSLLNMALASSHLRGFAMRSFFHKLVVTYELTAWLLRLPHVSPRWTIPCRMLLLWLPIDKMVLHMQVLSSHFLHLTSLAVVFPMSFAPIDHPLCTSADEWSAVDGLHQLSMLPVARQLLRLFVGIYGGVNCGAIELNSLNLERFPSLTQLALCFDSTPVHGIISGWTHIDSLWFSPNIMWQLAPHACTPSPTVSTLRVSFLDTSHVLTNTHVRNLAETFLGVNGLPRSLPSVSLNLLLSLYQGLRSLYLADFILDASGLSLLGALTNLARLDLHPNEWQVARIVQPSSPTYSSPSYARNLPFFPLSDCLCEEEHVHVAVFIQTVLPQLISLEILHIGTRVTRDVMRSRELWGSFYKASPTKLGLIGLGVCHSYPQHGAHETHRYLTCTLCKSFGFDESHDNVDLSASFHDVRLDHFEAHSACPHDAFNWLSTTRDSTHYESVLQQSHIDETSYLPYHVDSDGNYWSD